VFAGSAGASSRAVIVAAALTVVAGCSGGDGRPDRLMDGSRAASPPVELEGIDDAVLTKVRVVAAHRRSGTASASCLARDWGVLPSGPSVERVGVATESVTFREVDDRGIFGCNRSAGPQESRRRWCGGAYGLLHEGRLGDPRLDILCGTTEEPVGFVWVTPGPETRYVSVEQPGYVEVYEVAGGIPVRAATVNGVDYERSAAHFDVLEHDAQGRRLREYRLDAAVAG
jgi:hypothetical protein